MKLIDNKTGKEICYGDERITFSGNKVIVKSITDNLVHVEHVSDKVRAQYYPHVIGARIEFEE